MYRDPILLPIQQQKKENSKNVEENEIRFSFLLRSLHKATTATSSG